MTCIVGWIDQNCMVMGGDSAGIGGYDVIIRKDPKVFTLSQSQGPDMLIGFTSSFRIGQLLMTLEVPTAQEEKKPFLFMVKQFIPAVRKLFQNGGFLKKEKEQERGGTFLVGYRGRLFQVEDDFQVGESRMPYDAVGCGADFALGALRAMEQTGYKTSPERKVLLALQVAHTQSAGVRPPFKILKVDLKNTK